jgi:hypothetical protein
VKHCIEANPMKLVEHFTDDEFAQHLHRALRELPDAPAAWQQGAIALWSAAAAAAAHAPASTWSAAAQAAGALVRFVTAALTFDSWATPGLAHGMRSARHPTRHLLYSAQGRDIDLRITAAAEHFSLNGQVLGPDETGRVELVRVDAPTAAGHQGVLDEMGEFRLEGVPAGRYVLTLHLGAESVVVPAIEVGETAA